MVTHIMKHTACKRKQNGIMTIAEAYTVILRHPSAITLLSKHWVHATYQFISNAKPTYVHVRMMTPPRLQQEPV